MPPVADTNTKVSSITFIVLVVATIGPDVDPLLTTTLYVLVAPNGTCGLEITNVLLIPFNANEPVFDEKDVTLPAVL